MNRIVKCDRCGVVFESEWTEEEAVAEKEANFGDMPIEQMSVVCDPCYKEIMGAYQAQLRSLAGLN